MKKFLTPLTAIASTIGKGMGVWVSVSLLGLGKMTTLVTKIKSLVPKES